MSRTLLILFVILGLHTYAQEETEAIERPYNFDDWRVAFQMNGPNNWSAAINFIKPVHPKFALRIGVNPIISFNRSVGENPNENRYAYYDDKAKNLKWGANVSFGGEFHPVSKSKIDPYFITGLGVGGFTEVSKRITDYRLTEAETNGFIGSERESVNRGASSLNITPFGGFGVNYYFHERLAFGIEYTFSPNMNLVLGWRETETKETTYFDDGRQEEELANDALRINAFILNVNQQIGFHMIYILSKK